MDKPVVGPKPGESAWIWLAKILSGMLVIVLLAIHFAVNHLLAPEGLLTYADVVAYYSHWIVPVMEIAFLVFVVSHALIGLRSILLDLNPPAGRQKIIDYGLTALGAAAIGYGAWLIVVIATRAAAAV